MNYLHEQHNSFHPRCTLTVFPKSQHDNVLALHFFLVHRHFHYYSNNNNKLLFIVISNITITIIILPDNETVLCIILL